MKHAVLVALSLVALGCAGVEPVTVTPAQQPVAPAEVSLDARPSPPPPPQPQVVASAQPTPPAPPVAPTPTVLKGPLDQQEFGMIGLLGASGGGDALSAQGNMWGSEIGDSFGAGGLGLSGVGTGGGGRGEGIGIGSIGQGAGAGHGFGPGRLGGSKGKKPPQIRMGATTVTGRLPPEIIQRIVRQNYGRFRLCYENGLRSSPGLGGRVTVKFVIERDGSVGNVSNGGSDLPSSEVVSCVVRAFYGLSFPQPEGGKVIVTYPIMFSPGDDTQGQRVIPPTARSATPTGTAPAPKR